MEYAYDETWAENNVFEDGDLFYLDELSPEEMLAGMLAEIEGTPDPTLPAEKRSPLRFHSERASFLHTRRHDHQDPLPHADLGLLRRPLVAHPNGECVGHHRMVQCIFSACDAHIFTGI